MLKCKVGSNDKQAEGEDAEDFNAEKAFSVEIL